MAALEFSLINRISVRLKLGFISWHSGCTLLLHAIDKNWQWMWNESNEQRNENWVINIKWTQFFSSLFYEIKVCTRTLTKKKTHPKPWKVNEKNNTILVVIQEKVDSILVVCALRTLHVEDVKSRAQAWLLYDFFKLCPNIFSVLFFPVLNSFVFL